MMRIWIKRSMMILGLLGLFGLALGLWSGWSLLGLMNRLDGALAAPGSALRMRGESFGPAPRQKLNVWSPGASGNSRDVIIFFYGGSWKSGDRDSYDFAGRALAEQGYIVVVPDYRLVPQVHFPTFVEDGAAAVAWTRANIARFGGNPNRIFVAGHSAGAHIGAMLTLDPQWLAKAGAPADTIKGFAGLAGPYDFLPFTTDASKAAFGHLADPTESQPIRFVRKDAPPMLLLTGDSDTTVKPRNSKALAAALIRLGAQADLKIYHGVDHSGIVMAIARPFRDKATVLADIHHFVESVR